MKKFILLYLFLVTVLTACSSPMGKLEPKIEEFNVKYPHHLEVYQGVNRQMQYAWSGNPKNPPLIFIHGSPGGWDAWVDFLLNEELQKDFHLIAVDRPGYGGSKKGETEISLIMAVMQFNKSGKKAILIGHSYGGAVIAQIAADMPDKISALIFVASSVDPALEETKWYQYPANWWPLKLLLPDPLRVCNEEIMALKKELEILKPRWNEIKADVGTIQGDADDLVPLKNQDFIMENIAQSKIKFKERKSGMNHFVPWQHPELILQAIDKLKESH